MDVVKKQNPFLSIWFYPKKTIKMQSAKSKRNGFFSLCFIAGLVYLSGLTQVMTLGFYMNFIWTLVVIFILAILFGYVVFSLGAFFVYIVGKCMKGKGQYKDIRLAIAWSHFPLIISLLIWILLLMLYGQNIFVDFPGQLVLTENEVIFLFLIMAIQLVVYVWIIILLIQTIAEVQNFNAIKSILNLVIASLLVLVISIGFFIGFLWIYTLFIV